MRVLGLFTVIVAGTMAGHKLYEWCEDAYQWMLVDRAKRNPDLEGLQAHQRETLRLIDMKQAERG